MSRLSDGTELGILAELLAIRFDALIDLSACIKRCHAVHIGRHRGGGGNGVGDLVGTRIIDVNIFQRNTKGLGSDGSDFGVKTLSHFRSAVADQNSTVRVNVDKSPSLIHRFFGERNTELGGNKCQASLLPFVAGVECVDCLAASVDI